MLVSRLLCTDSFARECSLRQGQMTKASPSTCESNVRKDFLVEVDGEWCV